MHFKLALSVALTGSMTMACAGEKKPADGQQPADAQLVAEQRPGGDAPPAGDQPGPGEQPPPSGQPTGEQPAGGGPWQAPGCELEKTSIYYTGILTSMTTGEAACSRQILVCGDSIRTDKTYNSAQGEKCPFVDGERTSIAFREDGAMVCCDEWNKAKESKSPCDPLADADCDGILNDDDLDTLTAAAPSPG